ncbi:MAG TPA: DUF5652 family protein [Candidatus Nanoarchaeia archaeon]|nr:DUF5652 family protein [Candidatus Nanoarchaeia archaeon]
MTGLTDIALQTGLPIWAIVLVLLWTFAWKGVAWWKSARRGHLIWFVLFFIIHTMGILEILYIFLFSKINLSARHSKRRRKH